MGEDTKKVYVALMAFEHDGQAYSANEKYELTDEVVSALPAGTVQLFEESPAPAETPAPEAPAATEPGATAPAAPAPEAPAPEGEEKKDWAGGHTVGRE